MQNSIAPAQPRYEANGTGKNLPALTTDQNQLLQYLTKPADCFSLQMSYDGKYIYYIKNEKAGSSIMSRNIANGDEIQLYKHNSFVSSLKVSPSSEKLSLDVSLDGSINTQVLTINSAGETIRQIQIPNTICQASGWMKNIDNLVVWVSGFDKTPRGLYIIDDTLAWRPLFIARGRSWLADSSRDGRKALIINRPERGLSHLYLVDCSTQEAKPLIPLSLEAEIHFAQFSQCEKYIYIVSNINSDRYYLGIISTIEDSPMLPAIIQAYENADLTLFSMLKKRTAAAACWTTPRSTMLETYKLIGSQLQTRRKRAFAHIRELSSAIDGKTIAISSSSATMPSTIHALDLDINPDKVILSSLNRDFVEPEYITLQASDGLEMSGWLYQARSITSRPGPIVISFHGGPEAQETSAFNPLYQFLLKTGIAIFAPNVRGSTGFGKKFAEMDNGILRKNAVHDIKDCVEWILKKGLSTAGRIGIMGSSYGGYMTMMGMMEFPEYFGAGVSTCGMSSFLTFFKNTTPYMAEISKREYGNPKKDFALLKSLSPYYKLASLNAPILLIHGENDGNVPYTESLAAFKKLTTLKKDSGLLSIPNEGHCISDKENQALIYEYITRWFLRFL
ncbi:hypothetical protein CXB49_15460 [Chromobacterium sp. ATCC 53434]|uniref:S9 family peptidase n=1 Tax=Chromobacterium sp. (strain ATCC 53434 / SC 14030) TaxID=2059672 RepID=UPI000C7910BE|nr:prolyl oligopeptidase family serine peptidase [Chromobacterium sp. ATCC 53434]AUH52115.1 hypothetical protein CXB49_15460 [Chromobacterium sp. ATCC 53434]